MKKIVYILVSFFIVALLSFGTRLSYSEKNKIHLETKYTKFIAGQSIELVFSSDFKAAKKQLYIIHSYGKTLLESKIINDKIVFKIPPIYTQKAGVVSWFLIENGNEEIKGTFEIIPNNKTKTQIENYLGPRSILAGGADFTMMVTVPTDSYDNPKQEGTEVVIKDQFLNSVHTEKKKTKNFITWKNIYSNLKSGQILAYSAVDKTASKEIETEVYPNIATDFSINYSRNHDYADGNQITTISSSVIKDQYGNIVSDGTMVLFSIQTKNNLFLKTIGTTINGIASGQILHPDHPDIYTITAYITGIAKSNPITVSYKSIISSFTYRFSNKNRKIKVGPLTSFMGQLVPDGIKVTVKIYAKNKLVETLIANSSRGIATFNLPDEFYKEDQYRFEITTLGVTQKTETKNYDISK